MFVLAETLSLHTVQENVQELLAYLDAQAETGDREIILDASKLRDIDTAGLQFLLSASKTVSRIGLQLRFINAGEFLSRLLELSGAGDILGHKP